MKSVTVYSTPTCGYCKLTKAFLDEHKISYTNKDVSVDTQAQEEMIQKSGQMGVPVIDIDGSIIAGFYKTALSKKLGIA